MTTTTTTTRVHDLWLLLSLAPLSCSVPEPTTEGTRGPDTDASSGTSSSTGPTTAPPGGTTTDGSTSTSDGSTSTSDGSTSTSDGSTTATSGSTTSDGDTATTGQPIEISCAEVATQYTCDGVVPGYEDVYYMFYYEWCQQIVTDAAMYSEACLAALTDYLVCITALDCLSFLNDERACLVESEDALAVCPF